MSWLELPAQHTLSLALLHFLWQGALIALVLAASLRFARASSRARYTLAVLALAAMPCFFVATFILLPPHHEHPAVLVVHALPVSTRGPAAFLPWVPVASWRFEDSLAWAAPIWMAGVVACYLRGLVGWFAAQRMRRVGVCDPIPV